MEDIVDEVMSLLRPGWDTTTWTASFTLLLLGLYPAVQDKVYEEITTVVHDINNITVTETSLILLISWCA